jgi:ketosteroid isomerase-like protein
VRKISIIFIAAAFAALLTACSPPPAANSNASNSNTISNANTATPTPSPASPSGPSKDELVALETKAFEAWKNKDADFWNGFIADNYTGIDPASGKKITKADFIKGITGEKCEVKSYSMSDEQVVQAGDDQAVLSYKLTQDAKCGGKQLPANVWAATLYIPAGTILKVANHSEIPAMEPKPADPAKPAANKPAANDKPAAPAAPAAPSGAPAPAPNSDPGIAAVEKGWEAWKNRDFKALDDGIAKDFVFLTVMGQRLDHTGAIKFWSDETCDVKSVSFADAASTHFGAEMQVVTLKGTASGTCDGKPVGSLYGIYVVVKDGDAWKPVLIVETPAK